MTLAATRGKKLSLLCVVMQKLYFRTRTVCFALSGIVITICTYLYINAYDTHAFLAQVGLSRTMDMQRFDYRNLTDTGRPTSTMRSTSTSTNTSTNTNTSTTCPRRIGLPVVPAGNQREHIPHALYSMNPKLFDSIPKTFLDNFTNPCWQENNTVTCVPFYFLIGFSKSGTSDIWTKICRHPNVVCDYHRKESHFWTMESKASRYMDLHDHFRVHYKKFSNMIKNHNPRAADNIIGDGTPSTIWFNSHWATYFDAEACKAVGPPYVFADIIHTVLPDAKMIVTLRNPTDRLYSDFFYFSDGTDTPDTFHLYVIKAIEMFNACVKEASFRACAYTYGEFRLNNGKTNKRITRITIGFYDVFLHDWLNAFPRDQFFVVKFEEWRTMCLTILPEIFSFLKLEGQPEKDIKKYCTKRIVNKNSYYHGEMLPETKQILDKFYQSSRQEVARILENRKYLWEDNHQTTEQIS
ncbi:carbohydrate sulfotransferase 15-like [Amphiura filiformis]|uniref:carbohydrate sulfotransferase 15-like n=1 Tax=Amphiura filiformis TaxID=82378 RepID=UPI003B225EA0